MAQRTAGKRQKTGRAGGRTETASGQGPAARKGPRESRERSRERPGAKMAGLGLGPRLVAPAQLWAN